VHSPFVFDFIQHVLKDDRHFYAFDEIQSLRDTLLKNKAALRVDDFGAGSHVHNGTFRRVCDIARNAGRTPDIGKLLFRIVHYYQCKNILELGTSLGLGTAYLASATHSGKVVTIEGSSEIAQQAQANFKQLGLSQIEVVTGEFDAILTSVLSSNSTFDLVFIDGNHREEPTLQYTEMLLPHISEHSILIYDDIHWSKGMHNAWNQIIKDPRIMLSIDLFQIGLVFFRKDFLFKQHFVLKR
jgi:predicted O-methyltransferase YrrM